MTEAQRKLTEAGVFKGAGGLEGLLNANEFWDQQPYGTRLYYGEGGLDYLHRDVLRAAVEILNRATDSIDEPPWCCLCNTRHTLATPCPSSTSASIAGEHP